MHQIPETGFFLRVLFFGLRFPPHLKTLMKNHALLPLLTGFFVLAVTGLAFLMSFHALADLAEKSGVVPADLAWAFPLAVDGAILVFSLAYLCATIRGEKAGWYRMGVLLATVLSVGLNVWHSWDAGMMARVISAVPPVLLAGSFETVIALLKSAVSGNKREPETDRPFPEYAIKDGVEILETKPESHAAEMTVKHFPKETSQKVKKERSAPLSTRTEQKATRKKAVKKLISEGLNNIQIAEVLSVTDRTVRNLKNELLKEGEISLPA
ncbi:MAG: DUF2637 domain-containing protein [Verrucomicrobiota bacterium]